MIKNLIGVFMFINISLGADRPASSDNLFGNLLDFGTSALKVVDEAGQEVLSLRPNEENKIGLGVSKLLKRSCTLYEDQPTLARVKRLADPLLRIRKRKEINYSFLLVEARQTNAFSHLGGFVYLNRGLFKFASSDAELQFVLGHEIAHIDLGHCARKVTYAYRAEQLANTSGIDIEKLVQIAYGIAAVGFSQTDEFAADEWAYRTMRVVGRTLPEILAAPRALVELEAYNKSYRSPRGGKQIEDILDHHFRSHPPSNERLKNLENLK
jgi:predicted Zn-dependent protease